MTDDTDMSPLAEGRRSGLPHRLRLALIVALVLGVLALAWWGYGYVTHGRYQESTNNAYIHADSAPVAAKVSGYVREILVADNQLVVPGQPLVRIDSSDYDATVGRLRAEVAAADAQISAATATIREQDGQIDQVRAQLKAARVAVSYASGSAARYAALSREGAETRERYDNARYDLDRAKAEADVRQSALAAAADRTPTLRAQLAIAIAQRDAVRAQLAQANNTLSDTVIRASTRGVVGSKTVRVGQFVQPGQRLMTIVPSTDLYISANFKETQLALMRPGQPAKISIDALDGIELQGVVQSVSPATGAEFSLIKPENATGNFTKIVQRVPVRIRIVAGPKAWRYLRAGLSVTVSIDTRSGREELDKLEEESRKLAVQGKP